MDDERKKLEREADLLANECTHLQRRLAEHYSSGCTLIEAYKRAGGRAKSRESQEACSSEILGQPKCKAYYNHLRKMSRKDNILTRDQALEILSNIAQTKMSDVMGYELVEIEDAKTGETFHAVKYSAPSAEDIPEHARCAIKSVTMTRNGPKFELISQSEAIKQIRAMQGWDAPTKTELTGKDGMPLQVKPEVDTEEIKQAIKELKDLL